MIALHWELVSPPIHPIYIFVSKDKVVVSRNLLINEPSLASYNIASYFRGKQIYFWIMIRNNRININGLDRPISITVRNGINQFNHDTNLRRIDV